MSLVSAALFFSRRWISSEMSVAESSCAKRNSSILASISAIGCSNSRNVVFMGKIRRPLYSKARSVLDGNRVEAAPQVPACDRAPRRPALCDPAHGAQRYLAPLEVVNADRTLQPEIAERKHIGAHQVEHQEHLRGPAADAAHLDQLGDHRLVVHALPGGQMQGALDEMPREVAEILGLALRQSASAQLRQPCPGDLLGVHARRQGANARPDTRRGLDRDLLSDDRPRQSMKGFAARLERDARVRPDDAR